MMVIDTRLKMAVTYGKPLWVHDSDRVAMETCFKILSNGFVPFRMACIKA